METKLTLKTPLFATHGECIRIGTCKHRKAIYMLKRYRFNMDVVDYILEGGLKCNCGDESCYEEAAKLCSDKYAETHDLTWLAWMC